MTGLARSRTLHHCRKLSKELVLSFNWQRYILQTGGQPFHALRGPNGENLSAPVRLAAADSARPVACRGTAFNQTTF